MMNDDKHDNAGWLDLWHKVEQGLGEHLDHGLELAPVVAVRRQLAVKQTLSAPVTASDVSAQRQQQPVTAIASD